MPTWMRYCLLIAMGVWCLWYFGKMIVVGIRTGRVIDSRLPNGGGATRQTTPFGFWLTMAIAAGMILGCST
jgi:hypothetical protein